MSKYAIPEIRKRGGGVIVNTASVQGLQSMKLVPAYAASKGGILSLTRQMALDYAEENIRVLAVCPGAIDTNMVRTVAASEGGDIEATIQEWGRTHPIGRIGTGQEIANVVLFLASDKASFMTGEYVCVDGGYMALGRLGKRRRRRALTQTRRGGCRCTTRTNATTDAASRTRGPTAG